MGSQVWCPWEKRLRHREEGGGRVLSGAHTQSEGGKELFYS